MQDQAINDTYKEFSFSKKEKLTHKKLIAGLFDGSKSVRVNPIKLIYKLLPFQTDSNIQVLISVPKRLIKSAVKRNKCKRIIREGYRLNKGVILPYIPEGQLLVIGIIYLASEPESSDLMFEKLISCFARLNSSISKC